jgi:hypothetical protein
VLNAKRLGWVWAFPKGSEIQTGPRALAEAITAEDAISVPAKNPFHNDPAA